MDAECITIHNTANDASEKLAIKFVAQLLKERIVSANIKTGTASIVRTVFCQREEGTRLRLPSKQN
ncbi:hypothetical protein [Bacillus stercoris]|uniref:hypothetical protein n=1 Tax=Bacillus stercoris TaxID=2054641 RepID=UPI0026B8C689